MKYLDSQRYLYRYATAVVKRPSPSDVLQALHAFGLARDRLNIGLARRAGISTLDLHALEHLEQSGPLTPRALERRLGLTSGAVTALIDRLERVGWVARAPHPSDRRSVLVGLSEAAARAGDEGVGGYHRRARRAAQQLSPAERAAVVRFLDDAALAATETGDRLWGARSDHG
jgi:DNA-binding MarR family transcriptional regulator